MCGFVGYEEELPIGFCRFLLVTFCSSKIRVSEPTDLYIATTIFPYLNNVAYRTMTNATFIQKTNRKVKKLV